MISKKITLNLFLCLALLVSAIQPGWACTNILVSSGASADGSVYITYAADAPYLHRLIYVPSATYEPGSPVKLQTWQYKYVNEIVKQIKETNGIIGLMNDHQVAIGETTTSGRKELVNEDGLLDYGSIMLLALQRAKSAREAIEIIDQLVNEYGYNSSAETLSISDKNEAWMLEITGKGKGTKGAAWVAARVPEGYITVHANQSRIGSFPMDDPDNWLYSDDIVDFAVEKGLYDPAAGKPFSYKDAYHGKPSVITLRACAARVWSVYRRAAPSRAEEFSPDYHRGVEGAEDYPLFIKPDKKLTTTDVMSLMRDHFEGTPYDMTKGISAGPFGSPYRFKNLVFEYKDKTYCWERPVSTQQSGFVMVCQSRKWLPDAIGGIYWYSPDDAYTGCFIPWYCGITSLPEQFVDADINQFSWEKAWWVFNLVSNLTYSKYSRILPDVQEVQKAKEAEMLALIPAIDTAAAQLHETNPELARKYITDFCRQNAVGLFQDWQKLASRIITKHNDGYVNFFDGNRAKGVNYPDEWLERVIEEEGDALEVPPREEH